VIRRTAIALALLACALPVGEAAAGVRVYPGCGATLAACLKDAPGGTTVRLRTNADVPIPNQLKFEKSLTIEAAPGYDPGIAPGGTLSDIFFQLRHPARTVVIRGIRFVQVSIGVEIQDGSGHRIVFEGNELLRNSGTNGDHGFSAYFGDEARGSLSIRNNDISAAGVGIDARVHGGPATIVGNRVTSPVNGDSQGGIHLFSGGSGIVRATIASNLVHDVAGCNCGTPSGIQVRSFDTATLDLRILNNTLDAVGLDDTHGGMAIALIPWDTTATLAAKVYNNIVSNARNQGIVLYEDLTMTVVGKGNNTFNAAGGNVLGAYDLGTMYTFDPAYMDPVGLDFRLASGSPLENAGQTCIGSIPLPRGDAAQRFRVARGVVDVGAFERVSGHSADVNGKNLSGNGGSNTITGTSGMDVICGLAGADTLSGLGGRDLVVGGTGPDRAEGNAGNDWIDLIDGVGHDRAVGGPGTDLCLTDPGDVRASCE
jgi:hypothetical protein